MTDVRLLYVTTKDVEQARQIADSLVRRQIVKCANIFPQIESVYSWDGAIQSDSETVLVLKTTSDHVHAAILAIEALHSYDTPCILSVPVETGSAKYLAWIANLPSASEEKL